MKRFVPFSILALSLALSACKAEPEKTVAPLGVGTAASVTPAKTGDAPAADQAAHPSAVAPSGPVATLALDPHASSFKFVASKVTQSHDGSFKQFSGSATLLGDDVQAVAFEVDTASLETDTEKLTQHLKSKDFLEVDKFPKATFTSKAVKKTAGTGTYEITGDLNLHGVTQSLTFPVSVKSTPEALTGEGKITINRQKFAIAYPGMADDLIKDDVVLAPVFVFPKKK